MPQNEGTIHSHGRGSLVAERLTLARELQRKTIHILTSFLPLAYYLNVDRTFILYTALFLAIGFLSADLLRMKFALAEKYFLLIFSPLLRGKEARKKLTGATWLFLGMVATVFLFSKEQAVPAMFLATLADPFAALFGRRFGRKKYFGKTIIGFLVFWITAVLIIGGFDSFGWMAVWIGFICALLEFIPVYIDDNLLVPLAAGYLLKIFR